METLVSEYESTTTTPTINLSSVSLGDTVNVNLSGSHTDTNYPCKVVNKTSTEVWLLGTTNLGNTYWAYTIKYRWKVVFKDQNNKKRMVTDIQCPSWSDVNAIGTEYATLGFNYWTSAYYGGTNAYRVNTSGSVGSGGIVNNYGSVPLIKILI